ncbi:hypothetical protein [Pseudidiomarina sp.]|uniref:hypothetical protein n=1 Tax=Pseudidiomarina sp. TaxID=2081707 RepID=UPI003A96BB32
MLKKLALGSVVSCLSVALLWTPNASAQEPTLQQLRACAGIENPLKRLVCYDKVAAGEGVDVAAKEATTSSTTKAVKADPMDEFGLPAEAASEESDTIYVAISKTEKDPYGKWVIYLTNGQVWKQTDSQSYQLPLSGDYSIERGVLNGYFLGRDGLNKRIKVRRIK